MAMAVVVVRNLEFVYEFSGVGLAGEYENRR